MLRVPPYRVSSDKSFSEIGCVPPWLPWGHMKPEASLENTFWVLGLTAWSHRCTCQKRAATEELCFRRTKLPCGGVGGACTEPPELTRDTWAQQNYQTFIFPSAFCLLLCNGLTQAVGPASWGQPLAGNTEREGTREGGKTPQTSSLQGGWSECGL